MIYGSRSEETGLRLASFLLLFRVSFCLHLQSLLQRVAVLTPTDNETLARATSAELCTLCFGIRDSAR
jgi:hypothetical protein